MIKYNATCDKNIKYIALQLYTIVFFGLILHRDLHERENETSRYG